MVGRAGQSGKALAAILLIAGCGGMYTGGRLSDRWQRRGLDEAPMRVMVLGAIGTIVLLPIGTLLPDVRWTLALLFAGVFFLALPMGISAAALQRIFPNQVRGMVSALYLFILNIGGQTLGPLLPGVFNDYLFHNGKMIGYSLSITMGGAAVLMLITLLAAYRPLSRALSDDAGHHRRGLTSLLAPRKLLTPLKFLYATAEFPGIAVNIPGGLRFERAGKPCQPRHRRHSMRRNRCKLLDRQSLEQKQLHDSERHFQSWFEDAPVACHEVDRNGVILCVNQAECELFGFRPKRWLAAPFGISWRRRTARKTRAGLLQRIADEQPLVPLEREYKRRDGSSVIMEIHQKRIRDAAGRADRPAHVPAGHHAAQARRKDAAWNRPTNWRGRTPSWSSLPTSPRTICRSRCARSRPLAIA